MSGPQLRSYLAFQGKRSYQNKAAPLTCLRALLQVSFGRLLASAYVRVLSEPRPAFSPLTRSLASLRSPFIRKQAASAHPLYLTFTIFTSFFQLFSTTYFVHTSVFIHIAL